MINANWKYIKWEYDVEGYLDSKEKFICQEMERRLERINNGDFNFSIMISIDDGNRFYIKHRDVCLYCCDSIDECSNIVFGMVLAPNKAEKTEVEKGIRMFNVYKKDLMKYNPCRFNVIEYLCKFPNINPYLMAASLIKSGIEIVYDDSSISKTENEKKQRKVERILKNI